MGVFLSHRQSHGNNSRSIDRCASRSESVDKIMSFQIADTINKLYTLNNIIKRKAILLKQVDLHGANAVFYNDQHFR